MKTNLDSGKDIYEAVACGMKHFVSPDERIKLQEYIRYLQTRI